MRTVISPSSLISCPATVHPSPPLPAMPFLVPLSLPAVNGSLSLSVTIPRRSFGRPTPPFILTAFALFLSYRDLGLSFVRVRGLSLVSVLVDPDEPFSPLFILQLPNFFFRSLRIGACSALLTPRFPKQHRAQALSFCQRSFFLNVAGWLTTRKLFSQLLVRYLKTGKFPPCAFLSRTLFLEFVLGLFHTFGAFRSQSGSLQLLSQVLF